MRFLGMARTHIRGINPQRTNPNRKRVEQTTRYSQIYIVYFYDYALWWLSDRKKKIVSRYDAGGQIFNVLIPTS